VIESLGSWGEEAKEFMKNLQKDAQDKVGLMVDLNKTKIEPSIM